MQTGTEQIKRQQEIMKARGFYDGKIDGIWSDKTIAAKRKWELSGKFTPGIPNNGLPFADKGPYPRGVTMDRATGLLTCPELALLKATTLQAQQASAKTQTTQTKASDSKDE